MIAAPWSPLDRRHLFWGVRHVTATVAVVAPAVVLSLGLPGTPAAHAGSGERPVDFVRDVQPIFAAHCVGCHGPEKQRNDYRLDNHRIALTGGSFGGGIVPGDSTSSKLIAYVSGADPEIRMPAEGDPLTESQVNILRRWIDEGAEWPDSASVEVDDGSDHWAWSALVRPDVPAQVPWPTANPIDSFVFAALEEKGMSPAPSADRRALIRRVYFGLIGLPPTPAEVDAFVGDPDPQAYEKLIDRLLDSPHYGERWARHWMDAVHFAETHGHDQDRPRPHAWPYRDYLIESFNTDKPYGRFVAEQVAGDALYPGDPQATVALGFLAAGPWDESSQMGIQDGTIDKKIAQYIDRDDMIQNAVGVINSVTIHCARCHDHKFDPISQEDYYALQAVFAGVDRHDRLYDADHEVAARRKELDERISRLTAGEDVDGMLSEQTRQEVAEFVALRAEVDQGWRTLAPQLFLSANGATMTKQEDHSLLLSGHNPPTDVYTVVADAEGERIAAVRLEVMLDGTLSQMGPGRAANGNLHLSKFSIYIAGPGGGQAMLAGIRSATADFDQSGWTIQHAIDGDAETAWGIHPETGKRHEAVFVLDEPVDIQRGAKITVVLEQLHGGSHMIGRFRLSVNGVDTLATEPLPEAVAAVLAQGEGERSDEQRRILARHVLLGQAERGLGALPPKRPVYAVASGFPADGNFKPAGGPREVHLLARGNILTPGKPAVPGALSCLNGLKSRFELADPQNEAERRAGLARWLSSKDNVLTWRSMANRVWHYHMSRGIVDTPDDFGKMGSLPTHPQLLDWLAVEFRDSGGSLKQLHRMILGSLTYRQASRHHESYASIDAGNNRYWRGARRRLDAEQVRDTVLMMSGKLDLTMGGPSVKQFVERPGVHVTPDVDYLTFDVDDEANHRRSIYRFLFRTLPDPLMESLDCPSGSVHAPVRSAAVTPQQALALLNSAFIARQAEHIAARVAAESRHPDGQIRWLYQLAFQRDPSGAELNALRQYAAEHGLPAACRIILNTNEFIFID